MTEQELRDEELINAAAQKLFDTYMASNHRGKLELIQKAFNFAKEAHRGVRRLSGEPYILHPIAVAQIACEEIGLGSTSICAALLHDVVEDTEYTHDDLENLFGTKVANIVEGVTKISGGIFGEKASLQAETFKKMLLSMSDDIRVILIKISDRLHNMRTLAAQRPSKQYKIAAETLYIFAPLADRLGLNRIKNELEDLSFRYEHPEEYATIVQQLHDSQMEREQTIDKFIPAIREQLDILGVHYHISARVKSPYSIWTKMQRKHIPFEEVFDILAVRIVFTPADRQHEIEDCYRIYGALTRIYKPHPARFRDWLANPKANGYQALHNTFMSHEGKWIEVQIRSDRMDEEAEGGFAAHWKYKEAHFDETELDHWLGSIREILDDPQPDTLDLLDTIKLNLFASEIHVFTPKGEIRTMPQGATVLDFAFAIHSFLGSHCMGAKVNHKLMPLSYQLKSGDQIEILTTEKQHVSPDWLNFVTTGKAKGKIQAILRRENREKQNRGEEHLRLFLTASGVAITTAVYDRLALFHELPSRQQLFMAVADGHVEPGDNDLLFLSGKKKLKGQKSGGWRRFIPFMKSSDEAPATAAAQQQSPEAKLSAIDFVKQINRKAVLVLNEDVLAHCTIAPCCSPIPGDEVLGYITRDHTLEIHRRSCAEATKHKTRHGDDIIACSWDMHHQMQFPANIHIKGVDAHGVLRAIAEVFEELPQLLVRGISISTNDGIFEGRLEVCVFDTDDCATICSRLLALKNVTLAVRLE